jgi:hypothetical protein
VEAQPRDTAITGERFCLAGFKSFIECSSVSDPHPFYADPDPGDKFNADPYGSGSETLECRYWSVAMHDSNHRVVK